jgi:hypothetical protein
MNFSLLAVVLFSSAAIAAESSVPVAYTGEGVLTAPGGVKMTVKVWSDGVHTRRDWSGSDGAKSYYYYDTSRQTMWIYAAGKPCQQTPSKEDTLPRNAKLLGSETIDGHPAQKFAISGVDPNDNETGIEWRAADLGNLVIQWQRSNGAEYHLRHIVTGKPDAETLKFPEQCKTSDVNDTTHYAAQAPGASRSVSFFDLACKKLVPLPLTFSLPSDFEIREGGPMGCFAGRHDDLDRLLELSEQVNFDALKHAVIWVRTSDSTQFDPQHKVFRSELGSSDQWQAAYAHAGIRDVSVTARDVFGIPSVRVNAVVEGKPVRMFYMGYGDSPAILISYQPAPGGSSADDGDWQRFLDGIAAQ